jgi:hypothetical protein
MDASLKPAGTRAYLVQTATSRTSAARQWQHPTRRIIVSLIIVALVAIVSAGSWLVWTLTYDALGRQAASLAVVALLGGTFAVSREIARRS